MLMLMEMDTREKLAAAAAARIDRDYAVLSGVEELAVVLGVSKCHLIRCMTACTGESPGRRLQRRRLEMAALLLRGRDYPVETVARMTGFACGNYFSKVFRRAVGQAPLCYRQARRGALHPVEEEQLRRLEYFYQA